MAEGPEMAEEQAQEFAPSDDSAMAWIQGSDQKAEVPAAKPQETPAEAAPAPAATPTATPDIASLMEELKALKQGLNQTQSEVGQARKMRSEWEKFRSAQTKQPTSLDRMSPEERQQVRELVRASFLEEFGKDWEDLTSYRRQASEREALNGVDATARELCGEQFKELDPILGRLFDEFAQKAASGDQQAQRMVWEIQNTHSGIAYLVQMARQELSQTVKATEQKAVEQRQAQAKKAGTALTTAPSDPKAGEDAIKAFKNLSVADMRKKLIEAGAM